MSYMFIDFLSSLLVIISLWNADLSVSMSSVVLMNIALKGDTSEREFHLPFILPFSSWLCGRAILCVIFLSFSHFSVGDAIYCPLPPVLNLTGVPRIAKQFRKQVIASSAEIPFVGLMKINLEKSSTITTKYLNPCSSSVKGPIVSADTHCQVPKERKPIPHVNFCKVFKSSLSSSTSTVLISTVSCAPARDKKSAKPLNSTTFITAEKGPEPPFLKELSTESWAAFVRDFKHYASLGGTKQWPKLVDAVVLTLISDLSKVKDFKNKVARKQAFDMVDKVFASTSEINLYDRLRKIKMEEKLDVDTLLAYTKQFRAIMDRYPSLGSREEIRDILRSLQKETP
ncbi:hypothetical protein ADUPG1_013165 [Aduncisulcus paluster]|uniref:Retrotransposon gag domain-containing protein n=1 Tax=Aduncisulcus paluster TaxID=2918883 RepID=A0ABQ5K6R0_9EUKA|nr:hypothetical protein ADUPG1_013165 [Aduncisulcus paluster]